MQAVTLMGFSLTCGVLSALLIFNYSHELSTASHKQIRLYTRSEDKNFVLENLSLIPDAKYSEEHTLVGFIYGLTVVELIVAMWSAAICRVSDHQKSPSEEEPVSFLTLPTHSISFKGKICTNSFNPNISEPFWKGWTRMALVSPCKGIFACGIPNPGIWNPEYSSRNLESH